MSSHHKQHKESSEQDTAYSAKACTMETSHSSPCIGSGFTPTTRHQQHHNQHIPESSYPSSPTTSTLTRPLRPYTDAQTPLSALTSSDLAQTRKAKVADTYSEASRSRRTAYEAALEFWETSSTSASASASTSPGTTGRSVGTYSAPHSAPHSEASSPSGSKKRSRFLTSEQSHDYDHTHDNENPATMSAVSPLSVIDMAHMSNMLILAGQSTPSPSSPAPCSESPTVFRHQSDRQAGTSKRHSRLGNSVASINTGLANSTATSVYDLPSPTLQEVVALAANIPLPPSRAPSRSPSASVNSSPNIPQSSRLSMPPFLTVSLGGSPLMESFLAPSRSSSESENLSQSQPLLPSMKQSSAIGSSSEASPTTPSQFRDASSPRMASPPPIPEAHTEILSRIAQRLPSGAGSGLGSESPSQPPSSPSVSSLPGAVRTTRRQSLTLSPRSPRRSPLEKGDSRDLEKERQFPSKRLSLSAGRREEKRNSSRLSMDLTSDLQSTCDRSPQESPSLTRSTSLSLKARDSPMSLRRQSSLSPAASKRLSVPIIRETSPFVTDLNASLLDTSFLVASVGDKTYDELEIAVETNRERRRSMGLGLRAVKTTESLSSEDDTSSAETPPDSTSPVPPSFREPSPEPHSDSKDIVHRTPARHMQSIAQFDKQARLQKSTIFTGTDPEVLLDSESFQLTPPSSAKEETTPELTNATPLRPQASVALFDKQVRLQKSTIFTGANQEALLDSESFQLTPPSTVRTPSAPRTARTPVTAVKGRTPRSEMMSSRPAPAPPVAPTFADADMTLDLAALITRTTRPKRPSGTEESFMAPAEHAVTLADLSTDEANDESDTTDEKLVPESLRPAPLQQPAKENESLPFRDALGLPSALPRSDSTRTITRSDSTRTVVRSDSIRRIDTKRGIPRSDSTARLSTAAGLGSTRLPTAGSMRSLATIPRGTTTPHRVVNRSDVPLTMRRNAPATISRKTSSVPAPTSPDRWADANERDLVSALTAATPTARRMPSSVSTRRLSTLAPSNGLPRSGSTRMSLALDRERPTTARSGSTAGLVRSGSTSGLSRSGSTATLSRSGSSRVADRAASRGTDAKPTQGMTRTNSTKSITAVKGEQEPVAGASRVSATAASANAARRTSLAPRSSMATRGPIPPRVTAPRTSVAPRSSLAPIAPAAAPRTSTAPRLSTAPRTSTAPKTTTTRASAAPRSSTAPRASLTPGTTTTTGAAPRRSLLPSAGRAAPAPRTSTAGVTVSRSSTGRASSRPSLAPAARAKPFSDAAPAANRSSAPGAGVALARTKLSAPPVPAEETDTPSTRTTAGVKCALSTAATGAARPRSAALLEETKARMAQRDTARPSIPRSSSRPGGLAAMKKRMEEIDRGMA